MALKKTPTITVTPVTFQQSGLMNLANGEDATISISQTKYFAPEYDEAEYGGTKDEFDSAVYEAALEVVWPTAKRTEALLSKATSDSYQAGKTAALATGNYLTQDLKQRIVQVLRSNQAYADAKASDAFNAWKTAFLAKKAGAVKVLDIAKTIGEFDLD